MLRKICFAIALILYICLIAGTALASTAPSLATKSAERTATYVTAFIALIFITSAVFLVLHDKAALMKEIKSGWLALFIVITIAVLLRVLVALSYEGYHSDIWCFKGWAIAAYEQGPSNFYTSGMFADYPPGYMYVLYALGWIRNIFNIDQSSALFTLIIKIPSFIAETAAALIAYKIGKKHVGRTFGLLAGALIIFNPAMFFNSSVWGQIDAVFILFILLTLIYLKKENYLLGALFYALAMLIKPQAIMFAPVIGLAFIYAYFKKGGIKKALVGTLAGAAIFAGVIFLASLPFRGSQQPLWIIGKYAAATQTYQYASLNAFNIYALMGSNFGELAPFILAKVTLFGTTLNISIGLIAIVVICALIIFLQWRSRNQRPLLDLSAFLILSVFMLVHAMHERYIIPVCVLLVFSYLYTRDLKTLVFAIAFTFTALLGQMFTLYSDSVVAPHMPTIIISAVNTALYIVYAILTIRKYAANKILIKTPAMHG